jgi:hypothetical protein
VRAERNLVADRLARLDGAAVRYAAAVEEFDELVRSPAPAATSSAWSCTRSGCRPPGRPPTSTYRAESPLGRLVTVEQVTWMIRTLLAAEADALHGATLGLDGGARRGLI